MHPVPRAGAPRALIPSVLAVLLVVSCGDATNEGARAPAETTVTTGGPGAAPAETAPADEEAPDEEAPDGGQGPTVVVTVRDGAVAGGARDVRVPLGEEVVLRVESDVADEVHVHGYDLFVDVVPGAVAELRFVADLAGVWEVELEGAGLDLAALQVS